MRRVAVAALVALVAMAGGAKAQDGRAGEPKLSLSLHGGQMTTNGIDEVFYPNKTDFTDAYFGGVIFGYEVPLSDPRFAVGAEVQLNHHFGQDTFQELVLPVTIRYSPARPWPVMLDSFAFGLGLSHTTETPLLEVVKRGESQRTLVYFSLETAFSVGEGDDDIFFRLHHRSDGYGLFAADSGSNAFAVGWRHGF
ncbi:hypothetical protein [Roseovarius indicus]|uniref:hypothetical protein n=1 Tax=Roseovarius indicus TaxID=540747 RepID=UPI001365A492|nr:hypothetical protein [Roseovarius indicus]